MFNQIINSPNLLNFILPIFLADEDMRSDDEMYDKVPEKLIIHHYCKIPVCFYSFPDKKILRNSDFRAFNHGVKELYNAAVKNLEKSEFFIDPYYDEYDNIDDNIAEKLLDSEGYDPRKLFICGTECPDIFGAEAILSEKFLCKMADKLEEDYYILDGTVLDAQALSRELIILGAPSALTCSDNCKGLCPNCGQDLNEGSCTCSKKEMDPRMAGFAKLLEERKKNR